MKKTYIFVIFAIISSLSNAAQINYLTQDFYGFEDGGTAYWIQNNEWSVTTEKAADGTNYSIKFHSDVELDGQKKAHGGSNGSGISLPVGKYTVKMKVWIANDATFSAFNFTIKTPKWINNSMSIKDVAKEQWVELTKEFTVAEEIVSSGSLLTAYEGKGTFYVDEIQIWGEGELVVEPELIPFNSSIKTKDGDLNLPAGLYDVSMKVFIPDSTSIGRIYTQTEQPWTSQKWEIDTLKKDQWVEITQEVQFEEDAQNSTFQIMVSNHPDFGGGKGTLYIDDIIFMFKSGLAIHEPRTFDYKIYPNPACDLITIETELPGSYTMYSVQGRIVKQGILQKTSVVPVSHLKSGLYLFKISTEKGNRIEQIIIH